MIVGTMGRKTGVTDEEMDCSRTAGSGIGGLYQV